LCRSRAAHTKRILYMSEHYLMFSAAIDQNSSNNFLAYLVGLQIEGATKLTVGMSTHGGNVVCGITMYNHMLAMPFEIETHNVGNVDSIANAVFLGGKTRYASSTATFMFHGVGFDGNANERLEEKNLLEKLDIVYAENKRISKVMSDRSTLGMDEGLELFKEQKTRDADWAKEKGIIKDIKPFIIPAGANLRHLL
jgi:ATP-dependent protease ClpP protease subunit